MKTHVRILMLLVAAQLGSTPMFGDEVTRKSGGSSGETQASRASGEAPTGSSISTEAKKATEQNDAIKAYLDAYYLAKRDEKIKQAIEDMIKAGKGDKEALKNKLVAKRTEYFAESRDLLIKEVFVDESHRNSLERTKEQLRSVALEEAQAEIDALADPAVKPPATPQPNTPSDADNYLSSVRKEKSDAALAARFAEAKQKWDDPKFSTKALNDAAKLVAKSADDKVASLKRDQSKAQSDQLELVKKGVKVEDALAKASGDVGTSEGNLESLDLFPIDPKKQVKTGSNEPVNQASSKPVNMDSTKLEDLPFMKATSLSSGLHTFIGTRMTSPYTVQLDGATAGKIDSTAATAKAYLEFGWNSYWATDAERRQEYLTARPKLIGLADTGLVTAGEDSKKFKHGWDYDARLGVLLAPETDPGQTTTTTVIQSGDISASVAADWLWDGEQHETTAWTTGLGLRLAGSANRRERTVHPDCFLGMHVNVASTLGAADSLRIGLLRFGVGGSWIDRLKYKDGTDDQYVEMKGDTPDYKTRLVPTLEAEIWYPITKVSIIRIGAHIYAIAKPSPWSVELTYTVDPSKILNGIFPTDAK